MGETAGPKAFSNEGSSAAHDQNVVDGALLQDPDHATDNIGAWLHSLGLSTYERALCGTYDYVSQIINLYSNSISDFFKDIEVEDDAHRRIFEAAIQARSCMETSAAA